jgi:hypothetical protein
MKKTTSTEPKTDGADALLAGNSNSVKIANQDCGPVANVEFEEDDGEKKSLALLEIRRFPDNTRQRAIMLLAGNSKVSGHRCKYEEDDGALNQEPTGPVRFWREIQIPSK